MIRKFSIKSITRILALALVLCLTMGVFAFFTDRITANANVTTLDNAIDIVPDKDPSVTPDDPNVDPDDYDDTDNDEFDPNDNDDDDYLTNWWAYLNTKASANYNPADKMDLSYILKNTGELDVVTRETFIITSSKAMDATNPEFQLFSVIGAGTYGGYKGTTPIAHTVLSNTQHKYVIENGSITKAGSVSKDYYVVFSENASNTFQGATCRVDYLVEAMQADGSWATVVTAELDMNGVKVNAVPAA